MSGILFTILYLPKAVSKFISHEFSLIDLQRLWLTNLSAQRISSKSKLIFNSIIKVFEASLVDKQKNMIAFLQYTSKN